MSAFTRDELIELLFLLTERQLQLRNQPEAPEHPYRIDLAALQARAERRQKEMATNTALLGKLIDAVKAAP
jgi:hypothetical protein